MVLVISHSPTVTGVEGSGVGDEVLKVSGSDIVGEVSLASVSVAGVSVVGVSVVGVSVVAEAMKVNSSVHTIAHCMMTICSSLFKTTTHIVEHFMKITCECISYFQKVFSTQVHITNRFSMIMLPFFWRRLFIVVKIYRIYLR